MAKLGHLLIRTDGNSAIGYGHFMRCVALAQAWMRHGGEVTLLSVQVPSMYREELEKQGIVLHALLEAEPYGELDAEATIRLATSLNCTWIVLDGYDFGESYQKKLKEHKLKLLVLDDFGHCEQYLVDIILNQGFFADQVDYRRRSPNTKLLLGPNFTLFRNELLKTPGKASSPHPERFLIAMGGGDTRDILLKLIRAFHHIGGQRVSVKIITRAEEGGIHKLQQEINKGKHDIRLIGETTNISSLYQWADIAITSGGVSLLELMYFGVPTISLKTADNQNGAKLIAENHQATYYLGDARSISVEELTAAVLEIQDNDDFRSSLMEHGKNLLDGEGADRVIHAMTAISSGE